MLINEARYYHEVIIMRDIDVKKCAEYLSQKNEHYSISDEYNKSYGQVHRVMWDNQREHMVTWFKSQNTEGEGSFTRLVSNPSSKTTYNRLRCSEALLWIAEAVGVDNNIVKRAAQEAREMDNPKKRSGVIRKIIPWDMITTEMSTIE